MAQWWLSLAIYALLCCSASLSVMAGVGYHYFSRSILIFHSDIDLEIVFGVAIGAGIATFLGFWFFLMIPKFIFHYVVTFPLFALTTGVLIYFSSHSTMETYIEHWNESWIDSLEVQSFQFSHRCCGWGDAFDRGVVSCPIEFVSGCKHVIKQYLEPRYSQLLHSSVAIALIFLVSIIPLITNVIRSNPKDLISNLDVF